MAVIMSKIFTLPSTEKYKERFFDNSWERIILACQLNEVPDTWVVGDSKPMTINGVDYFIDIIGKNHDTYSDGSGTAPLTFQFHDCYSTKYPMHSTNINTCGWTNCDMRNIHLPEIKSLMPTNVQNAIRSVDKLTYAGGTNLNGPFTYNTTSDELFLLADDEIYGGTYIVPKPDEGEQYEYYAYNSAIKTLSGSVTTWLCRSPSNTGDDSFRMVSEQGNISNSSYANYSRGVAPAFCF